MSEDAKRGKAKETRADRLASALRENLRKRKAQVKARSSGPEKTVKPDREHPEKA